MATPAPDHAPLDPLLAAQIRSVQPVHEDRSHLRVGNTSDDFQLFGANPLSTSEYDSLLVPPGGAEASAYPFDGDASPQHAPHHAHEPSSSTSPSYLTRVERASSLPAFTRTKPPRRRTLESRDQASFFPALFGGGSNGSSRHSQHSSSASASSEDSFGMGAAGGGPAVGGGFWNPHTDHPLSLPEQEDLLGRIQRDLLGVDLDAIKGPLRALALSSFPRSGAGGGRDQYQQYQQHQQQLLAQQQQQQQSSSNPNQYQYPTPVQPDRNRASMMMVLEDDDSLRKTVSPKEAFMDYDDVDHRLNLTPRSSNANSAFSGGASLFAPLPPAQQPSTPKASSATVPSSSRLQPPASSSTSAPIMIPRPHSSSSSYNLPAPSSYPRASTHSPLAFRALSTSPRVSSLNTPPTAASSNLALFPSSYPPITSTSPKHHSHSHSHSHSHRRSRSHPFAVPQNAVSWSGEGESGSGSGSGRTVEFGGATSGAGAAAGGMVDFRESTDDDGEGEEELEEGGPPGVGPPPISQERVQGFRREMHVEESSAEEGSEQETAHQDGMIRGMGTGPVPTSGSASTRRVSFNSSPRVGAMADDDRRTSPLPIASTSGGTVLTSTNATSRRLPSPSTLSTFASLGSLPPLPPLPPLPLSFASPRLPAPVPASPLLAATESDPTPGPTRRTTRKRSRTPAAYRKDDMVVLDADLTRRLVRSKFDADGNEIKKDEEDDDDGGSLDADGSDEESSSSDDTGDESLDLDDEDDEDDDDDEFMEERGSGRGRGRGSGRGRGRGAPKTRGAGSQPRGGSSRGRGASNAPPNKRRRRLPKGEQLAPGQIDLFGLAPHNVAAHAQGGSIRCTYISEEGLPCGVLFRRPYDLARHKETIHNEGTNGREVKKKEWVCKGCGGTFSRRDALIRHARIRQHSAGL